MMAAMTEMKGTLQMLVEITQKLASSINDSSSSVKREDPDYIVSVCSNLTVVEKFNSYFKVRKNTIYERARFNRRDQHETESSEQ